MKQIYILLPLLLFTVHNCFSQVSINEISYYSTPQFIEVSGPTAFDLSGWKFKFYKGNGQFITTENLAGTMPSTEVNSGKSLKTFTTLSLSYSGPPGGIVALINPNNNTIQLLSYQGATSFVSGDGVSSINVGSATSSPLQSIQLTDIGWGSDLPTEGAINSSQSTLSVTKNQIKGFSMYPNPVNNGKFVITSNNGANKQVEIYSMIGKQVYSKTVKANETIDIANLNLGIYLLRVKEDNKVATRKLIVN